MSIRDHRDIDNPSDNDVIWRYYSTSKFLWVLQNQSLWLSRLDQFEDPFEGYSTLKNIERRAETLKDILGQEASVVDELILSNYESNRQMSLVNCWSRGDADSPAMWNSFVEDGDGIAIQSKVKNLKSAITSDTGNEYYLGEVNYVDYFEDFIDSTNLFKFVMSKPNQYSFEREIRLFLWTPNMAEVKDALEPPIGNERMPEAPAGLSVTVDLEALIDGVIISPFGPTWSDVDYWRDILRKYDIDIEPRMSKLALDPSYAFD